jgi:hypothetical protein
LWRQGFEPFDRCLAVGFHGVTPRGGGFVLGYPGMEPVRAAGEPARAAISATGAYGRKSSTSSPVQVEASACRSRRQSGGLREASDRTSTSRTPDRR